MGLRTLLVVLGTTLVLPLGAQTPSGMAEGTALTVAGVSAIAVNRPGRVTTAVKLRERPSTSAALIEYWSTTTQREAELFMPVGVTVLVIARTVEKEKVGEWTNYWYRVEFSTEKQGKVQAWAYGEFIQLETGGAAVEMVLVEGGTFQMGDTTGAGRDDERPVHSVTVSSIYLGKYEVTQKEWVAVMGSNPSDFKGDDLPVESMIWYSAVEFCNQLSGKEGLQSCYTINGDSVSCDFSRNGYRLPTEAEWEYAARGGRMSRGYEYAGSASPDGVAWHSANAGGKTHPVGTKAANELGLYDMSGNVWEWCWDWRGDYGLSAQTDPKGPASGSYRVLRGGGFCHEIDFGLEGGVRCAERLFSGPAFGDSPIGFRVARRAGPATSTEPAVARPAAAKPPEGFVLVEGGTFQMGDTAGEGYDNERPVHSVRVSSFYLGKHEVTQKEWVAVMGSNPSNFKGDSLPVEKVSWSDAVDFCNRLSAKEGLQPCYTISGTSVTCDFPKNGYRLPTEAEWEYAAKGGRSSRGYKYAGGNDAGRVAWYNGNAGGKTQPVGGKAANELGLYDMSGNVWEWCWDWDGSYSAGAQTDPAGPTRGSARLLRGGSWDIDDDYLRCAVRCSYDPGYRYYTFGFRVVRRGRM